MRNKEIIIVFIVIALIAIVVLYLYFKTPTFSPDQKYNIEKAHDQAIVAMGGKPDYTKEYDEY
jgi:hypothetical protein